MLSKIVQSLSFISLMNINTTKFLQISLKQQYFNKFAFYDMFFLYLCVLIWISL